MKGLCLNVDNAVILLVGVRFARPKTACLYITPKGMTAGSGRQTLLLQFTIDRLF